MNETEEVNLSTTQRRLIERLGIYNEKGGMSPAVARVLALLTVSDETKLSFKQIRQTLNLSKSATSNAINMLISIDKIESICENGERKRHFRSRIASWREAMFQSCKDITDVAGILDEIVKQRPAETAEFNQHMKEVVSFMNYIKERLPQLYYEWEENEKQ